MKNKSKKAKILELFVALALIATGVAFRFLPHLPNFTPIGAIALFGGVYLSRRMAIAMPILAMAISDFFIGSYEIKLMMAVYGSFVLTVFLGFWLKRFKKYHAAWAGSLASAFLFFAITNFAVWVFTPWYPSNLAGLIQCYVMALPFLKNDLMGTLFYTGIFFGMYELAGLLIKKYVKNQERNLCPKIIEK